MSEGLRELIALQEVDKAIRDLEGRIADLKAEEIHLRERLSAEEEAFRNRLEEHQRLRRAASQMAMEADDTDTKIRTYQKRLDTEIISYKEMEYLRQQVDLLRPRLDELEEEALRLMSEMEADEERLEAEKTAHEERIRLIEEDIDRTRDSLSKAEGDRAVLLSRREEVAKAVPAQFRQHYERLRESIPNPVVPVEDGRCSGCHLRLSEVTLERVREGREVVVCENCSRFLSWR